jgi:hypothetical protein
MVSAISFSSIYSSKTSSIVFELKLVDLISDFNKRGGVSSALPPFRGLSTKNIKTVGLFRL